MPLTLRVVIQNNIKASDDHNLSNRFRVFHFIYVYIFLQIQHSIQRQNELKKDFDLKLELKLYHNHDNSDGYLRVFV